MQIDQVTEDQAGDTSIIHPSIEAITFAQRQQHLIKLENEANPTISSIKLKGF